MTAVARLVTLVDVAAGAPGTSFSARHEAELADGRRVLLLDDRGWTSSGAAASIDEVVGTARVVVGPDEPFAGRSADEMEADHWDYLADILRKQGVVVDADALKRLPHDVVIGHALRRSRAGSR